MSGRPYTSTELRNGYRILEVKRASVRVECVHCGETFSAERDGDSAHYESNPCVECGAILCPFCPAAKCEGCDVRQCTKHLTVRHDGKWCKVCLKEATWERE